MRLFGYWRSSASYRIRIILNLKNIDFDYEAVDLLGGAQREAAYLARQPQGLVPALETDEADTLTQSIAIAEYLEERFPDPPLLPDTLAGRARARSIMAAIACEAQPFMNLRVQRHLKTERDFDAAAMADWLNLWGGGGLAAVERSVAETAGEGAPRYCVGAAPSLADAFLVPQMYAASRFNVDLSGCPRLVAIAEHCASLPAFQKAHPDNQPDAPGA